MADTTQNILINIDLETGQVNSELDKLDSKLGGLGQNTNPQPFKSIRQEILAAREEAVRLAIAIEDAEAAGQNVDKLSERYNQVTQRAAQLNDAVGDVNASIANANPDNRLQGLVSIAQGAITAVQGVAGAFALIGVDAETAQVAVAKLQGLIALTDAIGSIDKITKGYKDLTAVINLSAIAQKANNAATAAAAVVQRAFTGSVVATGTAFRLLRTAIIATGIGALVVLLGTAVAALMDFAESQSEVEKASSDAADALEREIKALDDLNTQIEGRNRVEIARLKAQGATEKQIRDRQIDDAYKAYERAFQLRQSAAEKYNQGIQNADKETFDRLTAGLDAATKKADQLYNDYLQLGYNARAADLADERKTQDAKLQKQQEINEKRKQDLKQLNEFINDETEKQRRRNLSAYEIELLDIKKRYDRATALAKAYGKNTVDIEKLRAAELEATRKKFAAEGEVVLIEKQLEATRAKVKDIADSVIRELNQAPVTSSEVGIRKILQSRSKELEQLFEVGAALRKEQLKREQQISLDEINKIIFEGSPEEQEKKRKVLIDITTQNFEKAVAEIQKEISTQGESLRKATEITLLDINVARSEENVKKAEAALLKLLVPFRKISDEAFLARNSVEGIFVRTTNFFDALREAFTTIDIGGEIQKIRSFQRDRLDAEQKSQQDLFQLRVKYSVELLNFRAKQRQEEIDFDEKQRKENLNSTGITLKERNDLLKRFEEEKKAFKQKQAEEEKNFEISNANDLRVATETLQDSIRRQRLKSERDFIKEIEAIRNPLYSFEPSDKSLARNFLGLSSENFKKQFDNALQATQEYYDAQIELENIEYQKRIAQAKFNNQQTEEIEKEHKAKLVAIERDYFDAIKIINNSALEARLDLADAVGQVAGQLSTVFDESTTASKGLAVAEIAINTATGFMRGLNLAQQIAAGVGPGPQAAIIFATFYASQIAAVIAAAQRATRIINGVKGGGGATTQTSGPTTQTPSAISTSLFNLPPEAQAVRVVGQPSQVVRAYITNEDLRSAQEKQAFLNKLSSF